MKCVLTSSKLNIWTRPESDFNISILHLHAHSQHIKHARAHFAGHKHAQEPAMLHP
jgi:hypothetical protein